jgi:hypothetical protein
MDEAKIERCTISLPEKVLSGADKVAADKFGDNRSAYVESVIVADLKTRGMDVEEPIDILFSELRATADLAPIDDIRQALAAIRLKASEKKRRNGKARAVA